MLYGMMFNGNKFEEFDGRMNDGWINTSIIMFIYYIYEKEEVFSEYAVYQWVSHNSYEYL